MTESTEGEDITRTDDLIINSDIIDTYNALVNDTGDKHTAELASLPKGVASY